MWPIKATSSQTNRPSKRHDTPSSSLSMTSPRPSLSLITNCTETEWISVISTREVSVAYTMATDGRRHDSLPTVVVLSAFRFPLAYHPTINRLTPNDPYMGRTAPLTSKRCILYIYSTNVGTEYFKHALYPPFFSLKNAVCFIMLTCLVPVLQWYLG